MGNLTSNPTSVCSAFRECCEPKSFYTKEIEENILSRKSEKPCDYGNDSTEYKTPAVDGCTNSTPLPHPNKLIIPTCENLENELKLQHGLHRTQPGTVFTPPFKHTNQELPPTAVGNKSKNNGNKPLRTSQSFVEFVSRKFTGPFSFNKNPINTDQGNTSSKNSTAQINKNGDISLAKQCLLDGDSSKKSIISTVSHPPSPSGSVTPVTPFAPSSTCIIFTDKEEEYARKIDLFMRTRGAFDARFPLAFSMKMTTLVREFLLLDSTNAYSDNVFSTTDILALIRKHPRFKLSRDKKSVSLAYLTPFYQEKQQILYGYFFCSQCKRRWESGGSWQDTWQRCKRCHANTFPYDQHIPLSRDKLMQQLYNMTHKTRKKDNQATNRGDDLPVEGGDSLAAELLNDEEDEDDEDLFTIDMISLRDRIELHRKPLCQKCIELGHLCIPYRHYSM